MKKISSNNIDSNKNEKVLGVSLKGFIPMFVSNNVVIEFFEILRFIQKIFSKVSTENTAKRQNENLLNNEMMINAHKARMVINKGFIEDQNSYTNLKYGNVTMKYAGCEVFAVYNAMRSILGKSLYTIPQLVSEFEKDGMVLGGRFGTSPKALSDFLNKNGFVTEFSTNVKEFDEIGSRNSDVIITYYNDGRNILHEIHTIHVSKENGMYIAHNTYCNGSNVRLCSSVSELMSEIHGGVAKGISIIGIKSRSI